MEGINSNNAMKQIEIYLLFHCNVARDLWNMVFLMICVEWFMPEQVLDLLTFWKGRVIRIDIKIVWNVIESCLI